MVAVVVVEWVPHNLSVQQKNALQIIFGFDTWLPNWVLSFELDDLLGLWGSWIGGKAASNLSNHFVGLRCRFSTILRVVLVVLLIISGIEQIPGPPRKVIECENTAADTMETREDFSLSDTPDVFILSSSATTSKRAVESLEIAKGLKYSQKPNLVVKQMSQMLLYVQVNKV